MNKTLKDLRIEKNFTQKHLASLVGVSTSYISRLENGHCPRPYLHVITKLILSLDCSFSDIIYSILNSIKKNKNKKL